MGGRRKRIVKALKSYITSKTHKIPQYLGVKNFQYQHGIPQKTKTEKYILITLTHCGKYLDQTQEANFHLGLVQSAKMIKWEKKKKNKGKNLNEATEIHHPTTQWEKREIDKQRRNDK